MLKKILKNGLMGMLLVGYCATIVPMDGPHPETSKNEQKKEAASKLDYKKLLQVAAWHGFDIGNLLVGHWRFLCEAKWGLLSPDQKARFSLTTMDQAGFSPQLIATVKDICAKSQLPADTGIERAIHASGSPASAQRTTITLDSELLDFYEKNEQAFIIAHEVGHIKYKDYLWRGIPGLAIPVVTYTILKGYEYVANKILLAIQKKYSQKKNDAVNRLVNIGINLNRTLSSHFLSHYMLNLFLFNAFTRYKESRADGYAVSLLGNAQGGIDFFSKQINPEFLEKYNTFLASRDLSGFKKLPIWDRMYAYLRNMDAAFHMPEHPSIGARVKALEAFQEQMNVGK